MGFQLRSIDEMEGFLDLDGIEVIDLGVDEIEGTSDDLSVVPTSLGSFDSSAFQPQEPFLALWTHLGTWPAFWIDRLQGIGFWASTQHGPGPAAPQPSLGWAGYSERAQFTSREWVLRPLLTGRTLGESLHFTPITGLWADPLYRPSAASLRLLQGDTLSSQPIGTATNPPDRARLHEFDGLVIDAANRGALEQPLLMNVLHGTANTALTAWEISTCSGLDPAACDAASTWTTRMASAGPDPLGWGVGAQYERVVEWLSCAGEDPATSHKCFLDTSVNQELLIRLKVWNPGDEASAIYDHVFIDYQVN